MSCIDGVGPLSRGVGLASSGSSIVAPGTSQEPDRLLEAKPQPMGRMGLSFFFFLIFSPFSFTFLVMFVQPFPPLSRVAF